MIKRFTSILFLLFSSYIFSQNVNILVLDKPMYTFSLSNSSLYDNPIDLYVRTGVITNISFQGVSPTLTDANVSGTTKTEYLDVATSKKTVTTDYHLTLKNTKDNKNSYYIIIPGPGNIAPNYLNINLTLNGQLKNLVFHLIPNVPDKGVINITFINDISISSKSDVSLCVDQCLSYLLLSNIQKVNHKASNTDISIKSKYVINTDNQLFLSFEITSIDGNDYFVPDNLTSVVVNGKSIDIAKSTIYCNSFTAKPLKPSSCIISLPIFKPEGFYLDNLTIQFGNLVLNSKDDQ